MFFFFNIFQKEEKFIYLLLFIAELALFKYSGWRQNSLCAP